MRFLGLILILLLISCGPGAKNHDNNGNPERKPSSNIAADIGNRVWLDENMDGVRQPDEPGIAGIRINLWLDSNSDGKKDTKEAYRTTITDDSGRYRFNGLDSTNNYLLEVELKLGYGITEKHSPSANAKDLDSDINPETGLSDSLKLNKGVYYYWIDIGLTEDDLASVGDKVWVDENHDGIKQNDEPGFADIEIRLWQFDKSGKSAERLVASRYTNSRGNYRFSGLFPKYSYKLEFILPEGYVFSEKHNPLAEKFYQSSESDWDSDVNPESGFSDLLKLEKNEYNYLIDAAMYKKSTDTVTISILPKHAELKVGEQISFKAVVYSKADKSVVWKTSGGLISNNGLYTAPKAAGDYSVTAVSVADPSKSATATVTVIDKQETISISIWPQRVELAPAESRQFVARVSGSSNKNVIWEASKGSIDSNGLYLAPNQVGEYFVRARAQANQNIFATAQVVVINPNSCKDPLTIDSNLAEALRVSLGFYEGQAIYCNDLLKIKHLFAASAGIVDIGVLKFAKNIEYLYLNDNDIIKIDSLKELSKIKELDLSENQIDDISVLADNQGLNDGDELNIENNCLDLSEDSSAMAVIDILEDRGVNVSFGGDDNCDN